MGPYAVDVVALWTLIAHDITGITIDGSLLPLNGIIQTLSDHSGRNVMSDWIIHSNQRAAMRVLTQMKIVIRASFDEFNGRFGGDRTRMFPFPFGGGHLDGFGGSMERISFCR